MSQWMVEAKGLKKYYRLGEHIVKALDGVDFTVKEQEFVAIVGKSGSGKSTLLHMLGGRPVDKRFMEEMLDLLKLRKKKEALPSNLSGGQQQRVAIARALASKPRILLADEPTGNLDSASSHDVLGLLKVAAKQFRQTVILITHDMDIAQMADRIVHIEDGKIVKERGLHDEK